MSASFHWCINGFFLFALLDKDRSSKKKGYSEQHTVNDDEDDTQGSELSFGLFFYQLGLVINCVFDSFTFS